MLESTKKLIGLCQVQQFHLYMLLREVDYISARHQGCKVLYAFLYLINEKDWKQREYQKLFKIDFL